MSIVKFPIQRPRTPKELLVELSEDSSIEEVVVIYKKTYDKGLQTESEAFLCESTAIDLPDLCMAERTLGLQVTRVILSESNEGQGFFTV